MSDGTRGSGGPGMRPPHPATVAPRAPHPATVAQPKPAFGGTAERPPHPATVVQGKALPPAAAHRPPHPATVAQAKARPGTAQRMELEKTSPTSEVIDLSTYTFPLLALLCGQRNSDLFRNVLSFLALEDLGALSVVCMATQGPAEEEILRRLEPGARRIELGAGNLSSAFTFGPTETLTAFTEYDSFESLFKKYGVEFLKNEGIEDDEQFKKNKNVIEYGVDATKKGKFDNLPRTRNLRFTNPNLGSEAIKQGLWSVMDKCFQLLGNDHQRAAVEVFGIWFVLDLTRLKLKWTNTKQHGRVAELNAGSNVSKTTNAITSCCNVHLLYKFFTNAGSKLRKGGSVELIVRSEYVKRWPIIDIASCSGYKLVEGIHPYNLGFSNVHTQTSEKVGSGGTAPKYIYLRFQSSHLAPDPGHLYRVVKDMFTGEAKEGNLVCDFSLTQPSGIPVVKFANSQ